MVVKHVDTILSADARRPDLDDLRIARALVFYFRYSVGLTIFATSPALRADSEARWAGARNSCGGPSSQKRKWKTQRAPVQCRKPRGVFCGPVARKAGVVLVSLGSARYWAGDRCPFISMAPDGCVQCRREPDPQGKRCQAPTGQSISPEELSGRRDDEQQLRINVPQAQQPTMRSKEHPRPRSVQCQLGKEKYKRITPQLRGRSDHPPRAHDHEDIKRYPNRAKFRVWRIE